MYPSFARHSLWVASLLFGGAVVADAGEPSDRHFHIGVAAGSSMTGRFDIVTPLGGGRWRYDSETPYAFYAGWNFHEHWSVEASYADLGQTVAVNLIAQDLLIVDGNLLDAGLRYRQFVTDRLELSAALGAFKLREDGRLSNLFLDPPPVGYEPVNDNQSGAYVELAGRFHFTEWMALRAAWRWYDFDAGTDGSPWLGAEFGF